MTSAYSPEPVEQSGLLLRGLYSREAIGDVLLLDGHGVRVSVDRGHLSLSDGLGSHRRLRRLSRADRTVRRVVVLGQSGHITLEAITWCTAVGISLTHLDSAGRVLLTAGGKQHQDPRLRRSQALAPTSPTGLAISIGLLVAKLEGQAAFCNENLRLPSAAAAIQDLAADLADADSIARCRELEAAAANVYFGAWAGRVRTKFTSRDTDRVPEHWHTFTARRSPLQNSKTSRKASDPINAMLNYAYALGEAECVLALRAVGLDPGLGIVHTDKPNRDSLALDLLEPLRPVIERRVLEVLQARHLRASDFHETPDGTCRLLAPLTHDLAADMPYYARTIAGHAEAIAQALARAHTAPVKLRTPLTKANARAVQVRAGKRRSAYDTNAAATVVPTCRTCGVPLTSTRRQLCDTCWPVTRAQLETARAAKGVAERARRRAAGEQDPTLTEAAKAKKHLALVTAKAAQAEWERANPNVVADPGWFAHSVLPVITGVPLARLHEATGLSLTACSRIRAGKLTPHVRHWSALEALQSAK